MSDVFTTDEFYIDGNPDNAETPPSPSGGEGHTYDLEMSATNDEMTLTEDGSDKTTLPIPTIWTKSKAEWDALSVAQKTKYCFAIFSNGNGQAYNVLPSHIGQIIESTTLATLADVRAAYGADTTWIQHEGYILRGASSNVTDNDNSGTGSGFGGSDTHKLTVSEMPSHTHQMGNGSSTFYLVSAGSSVAKWTANATDTSYAQATGSTGGDLSHSVMQKHKNIYIWERTA